nr:AraC family ligand binding domain-containing protein [Vibrio neptunius]
MMNFPSALSIKAGADYRNRRNTHQIGQGDNVTINPADVHSCNPYHGTWSRSMLFVDALEMGEIQQEMTSNQHYDYVAFGRMIQS